MIPLQPYILPAPEKGMHVNAFDYFIDVNGVHICVPGFFMFSASVPVFGWAVTYNPHDPVVNMPAMVHDWFFYNHQVPLWQANDIFYELLLMNRANKIKAKLMYKAVDWFGKSRWNHKPDDIQYLKELYQMCRKSPNFDKFNFPVDVINQ